MAHALLHPERQQDFGTAEWPTCKALEPAVQYASQCVHTVPNASRNTTSTGTGPDRVGSVSYPPAKPANSSVWPRVGDFERSG